MAESKELRNDKYRIIKIGKEALFEFIYEKIIDDQEIYFDIPDVTKITSHFDIDWDKGEFIVLIHNSSADDAKALQLPGSICLKKLMNNMNDTTNTMYAPNRYIDLSIEEIETIQNSRIE